MSTQQVELQPGATIEFCYPRHNYVEVRRQEWEKRRVVITRVRDLRDEPLDPVTEAMEPKLFRGKLLITGNDFTRGGQERSFYVERMAELKMVEPLEAPPGDAGVAVLDVTQGRMTIEAPAADEFWAEGFCRGFNADEQANPSGLWAVAIPKSTITSTIKNNQITRSQPPGVMPQRDAN